MNLTKDNISSILSFINVSRNAFDSDKDLRFVKAICINDDISFKITLRYEHNINKYYMECSALKNGYTEVKTVQDVLDYVAKCSYLVGCNNKIDELNKVLIKH